MTRSLFGKSSGLFDILFLVLTGFILLSAALLRSSVASSPPIKRPYEIIEATIEGSAPWTVDPALSYDTASGELLMNVYDTLVAYDGEHVDRFLPQLATEWTVENISGAMSPEGLPWYFRYSFRIRESVPFHDPTFGHLSPSDVEYCFERAMVLDMDGGPQWMFYEPLLNGASATYINQQTYDPENSTVDRIVVGKMIDHAVESNGTHVWFNLAFPGAYPPFLRILSSPWSSIFSRSWATSLDRPSNWDGEWGDYTDWWLYHNPSLAPFDSPDPAVMGTGPFILEALDRSVTLQWSANRFVNYWRGWPANWPFAATARGYINHLVVTWAYDWPTRSAKFLNGDVDLCVVPRANMADVQGESGLRCMFPLPGLSVDALFYNFNVSNTSPYTPIFAPGVFGESGIPSDFFGNPEWGINVRKAFAQAINFSSFIQDRFLGEAIQPSTAIIPGLPYYDPSIPKYSFNLSDAADLLRQVPTLWDNGFTITLADTSGSLPRNQLQRMIKANIESLNTKFHVTIIPMSWVTYYHVIDLRQLPVFTLGWVADYPDPYDFASGFYESEGIFSSMQGYSSPTMDSLIKRSIEVSDGAERATIYHDIQQLAIDDCPSVALEQPVGRHFERDWVCGWYYNPSYSGVYAYNLWKWYYVPLSLGESSVQPLSNGLPVDVNYDGMVNIIDIALIAQAFGSSFGPPLHPRWSFRADVNNDRLVNIVDIANTAMYFGKKSAVWVP